jgi:anti-sigma regulatory factor (Ser/Thr protein kinase)
MGSEGRLELTLPPAPASVAEARTRILEAVGTRLRDGEVETLRLLISELVTNAVRHGGGPGPVEVNARWDGDVRVEVVDHGDGFLPAPRAGALCEPGGFGLYLVGRLADRWGVETNSKTRVWFVLTRAG